MDAPRISPTTAPYTPDVQATFDRLMPPGVPPLLLFRTLAVNERVFRRLAAGGLLDRGTISLRAREIVIDRTSFRCGSEYEWGVHVAFFGARVGFTPAEILGLATDDPAATPFDDEERALLGLVDELHRSATLSDAGWAELRRYYTDEQCVELLVLVGYYHTIAFVTNACRLPLEPLGARFPDL